MKVGAVAAPVLVVVLVFTLVWGLSMAAIQGGVRAVDGGLRLTRMQMRVLHMQAELLSLSRQTLEAQLTELDALMERAALLNPETGAQDGPDANTVKADGSRDTEPRREWPRAERQPESTRNPEK